MIVIRSLRPILSSLALSALAMAALANENAEELGGCKGGNPEQQIEACSRLIESGKLPKDLLPHAFNNRGMAKTGLGDIEGALNDLDQALKFDPSHEHANLNRGYANMLLGNLDEAKRDFVRAMEANPLFAEPYIGRALTSIMNGETDLAIADLDKAIKFDPRNINAYINRGFAHRMKGDISKAIADFKAALKLDPLDKEVQQNLDELLQEQKAPSANSTKEVKRGFHLAARRVTGQASRLRYVLRPGEIGKNSITCNEQHLSC